jgi:hypothetical protein
MSIRFHVILSLGAFIAIFGLASQTIEHSPTLQKVLRQGTVDIGIEHSQPLSVRMEYSVRNTNGIMRIGSDSSETISISLPEQWERGEVTGAPLSALRKDDPMFGYTRWHVPEKTTITFKIPKVPEHIVLHNPSTAPLKLTVAKVDLETGAIEKDILLIRDSTVPIW